ncbi:FHA domain-containing serine/threonine-protein kinase [Paludisphaera mucosa]|uniref:Serine/threonine-protein kinase n=1 Tax=Paludisphaera mucosa TaxID=3030827 RepID=A0ABT6FHK2_9BACT|nr:FHA domain-containing serine/threonine-protein kinase [Paludisphaera mucosa]MDG3007068.1 serine/threonine-protein kinase [Paludisphaera mucosa]
MRVILEVIKGPREGRSFVFDRHDTFIVGRSQFVHCPINDAALSRDHFLIEISPPRCELRDLDSTNGTFVNNERIDRARLASGDLIAAGQSLFRIVVEAASPSGAAPPPSSSLAIPSRSPIFCAGCGTPAPLNLTVNNVVGVGPNEPVEWWCSACRSEASSLPQPVPHYTTVRELGRGAMGVVYQARHNTSGRMVALKLIMPETATTRAAIDRFQREMSVISQLRHPNIVEWFEQGMSRGQFWFAMEFITGSNLEGLAKLDPGRYPTDQACRLACQILKGLEHAHRRGFVHRDIKPENVLIGQTPEGSVAKISDFGLAKSFRSVGLSGLTFSGEMRGTIPFMPPEQMTDFKTVRPQADLYATAATLYYLLTGKYIYDEPEGGGDLIKMLLEEHPIPILERRPDIPAGLAAVVGKCLARDPEERYPDATAMRRALKPFC